MGNVPILHYVAFAPASMFERSELWSRREERMENGVKNLKGARLFPMPFLITEMEILTLFRFYSIIVVRKEFICYYILLLSSGRKD